MLRSLVPLSFKANSRPCEVLEEGGTEALTLEARNSQKTGLSSRSQAPQFFVFELRPLAESAV